MQIWDFNRLPALTIYTSYFRARPWAWMASARAFGRAFAARSRVRTFLNRPIDGDLALCLARRVNARRDEVLGVTTGNSEDEPLWVVFFGALRGVKLVISGGYQGLQAGCMRWSPRSTHLCRR